MRENETKDQLINEINRLKTRIYELENKETNTYCLNNSSFDYSCEYQTLFENLPQKIFIKDPESVYLFCNELYADMLGVTQKTIKGKTDYDFYDKDIADKNRTDDKRIMQSGQIELIEKRYVYKGEQVIAQITKIPVKNNQGKCVRLIGIFEDITEVRKTQEQIKSLAKFPEESPNSVMRVSLTGEIIYANKVAKGLLVECNCDQGQCLDNESINIIVQAYTSGKSYTVEKKCKQKIYSLIFAPILGNNYVNIYGFDITRRKSLEQALEKRIIAMSQPLDEAGEIGFDVLFNIKEIQSLQDLFAKSTKVASIIKNLDGTPITQPSNFCRLFNDFICDTETGLKNYFCLNAVTEKNSEMTGFIQPFLSTGLWAAGARITVGGKHIATWLIGQVRNDTLDKNQIKAYADKISADVEEFSKAFEEVPVMAQEQFQNVADTLFVMAKLLSSSAYQNIQQSRFITELKQVKGDLICSSKRFYEMFENMSSGVSIFEAVDNGEDFIFKDFNRAGEKIDKISRYDLIGKRVTEVFPGVREYGLLDVFKRVFKTGDPEHFADKIYKDYRIQGWRRNYIYKLPIGEIIAVYDDITEQKIGEQKEKEIFAAQAAAEVEKQKAAELFEAYKELRAMQDQLLQTEKLASIGQLGSGVAHELNNPLAGILSLLRSYKKEKDENSEEYDDLNEMEKACEHMAKIIKGLNSFSRQSIDEIEDVDCNEAIKSVLSFTSHQLDKKNVRINTDLAPDLIKIRGNGNQIQQIVINMVTNAGDACLEKGIFSITTNNLIVDDRLYVEMRFSDNGCGILKENLKKIFDPFFTTKRPGGGVGLGLSIVYKIVENHRGTITVDSVEAQGTVFTIILPEH